MKSAKEIKELFQAACVGELPVLIKEYENDERAGVKKILESAHKRIIAYETEMKRTEELKKYEKQYDDYRFICGIDEVGRGPLAGPVVAGAVILPGVTIGEGAVVGANSVVDRNLKPWTIYHGNPVKKVGMREKPTEASMKAIEGMDWTKHF